jgi:hypothetical protein
MLDGKVLVRHNMIFDMQPYFNLTKRYMNTNEDNEKTQIACGTALENLVTALHIKKIQEVHPRFFSSSLFI